MEGKKMEREEHRVDGGRDMDRWMGGCVARWMEGQVDGW
jgi:hypothetical protein